MTRDVGLQAGTCAGTRVVSSVPQQEFKVQLVRWRVAAWCLGPSDQRCSMFFTVWKKLVFPKHGVDCMVGIQCIDLHWMEDGVGQQVLCIRKGRFGRYWDG